MQDQDTDINFVNENTITYQDIESFTVSAEEAANILGVNRSRLSQLTSKGVFHFERRKIDTRNRLFYKLSDLLNHQRSQIQGSTFKQTVNVPQKSILEDEQDILYTILDLLKEKEEVKLNSKIKFPKNKSLQRNIDALTLHKKETVENEILTIHSTINKINDILNLQNETIQKLNQKLIRQEQSFVNLFTSHENYSKKTLQLLNKEFEKLFISQNNIETKKAPKNKFFWNKKKPKYHPK